MKWLVLSASGSEHSSADRIALRGHEPELIALVRWSRLQLPFIHQHSHLRVVHHVGRTLRHSRLGCKRNHHCVARGDQIRHLARLLQLLLLLLHVRAKTRQAADPGADFPSTRRWMHRQRNCRPEPAPPPTIARKILRTAPVLDSASAGALRLRRVSRTCFIKSRLHRGRRRNRRRRQRQQGHAPARFRELSRAVGARSHVSFELACFSSPSSAPRA